MEKIERQKLVEECRASGMTAKAWCEEKGIAYRQYLNWATKQNKEAKLTAGQQWVTIEVSKETVPECQAEEIRLERGKWQIWVGSGFNPSHLADILRVVELVC